MPDKKATTQLPDLLTISQAAILFNVTKTTLRRWDKSGHLVAIRFGPRHDRRYRKQDILNALNKGV